MKEVKMNRREIVKMQRKVQSLQKALAEVGPLMRGSVVVIGTKNKQPYFSLNKDKKTRLIYLGKDRLVKAQVKFRTFSRFFGLTCLTEVGFFCTLTSVSEDANR
jgi:hypothetical protein